MKICCFEGKEWRRRREKQFNAYPFYLPLKMVSPGVITPKTPHAPRRSPDDFPPLPSSLAEFAATCEITVGQNARRPRVAVLALARGPVDALYAQVIGVVLAASSPSALQATDGAERT